MSEVKAFIFDLDGVLTETSEQHYLGWKQLADELNISIDREFNEELKGVSRLESLDRILKYGNKASDYTDEEKIELATKKNNYYVEMIQNFSRDNLFEGVIELFKTLKSMGIKIAIGSASRNAPRLLKGMDIIHYIDHIVDPTSVENGKPAPDIFLSAAKALDVEPNECIGVEDAFSGVEAIKSAGMFAVGIGDKKVLHKADIVYKETKDIDLKNVLDLFDL